MEVKVEAKNLELRNSWQEKIEEERAKLIRHYANFVLHLRVSIEATTGYKEGGYEVALVAGVPGDTVVVKRWGENVRSLLVEAFDVLGAQLKDIVRKKQNHKAGKSLGEAVATGQGSGVVRKLFASDAYGFITSETHDDVFFQAHVLKDTTFDTLAEGDAVEFAVEQGEKGLQATWVRRAEA